MPKEAPLNAVGAADYFVSTMLQKQRLKSFIDEVSLG